MPRYVVAGSLDVITGAQPGDLPRHSALVQMAGSEPHMRQVKVCGAAKIPEHVMLGPRAGYLSQRQVTKFSRCAWIG
jgi:hypothetical protein